MPATSFRGDCLARRSERLLAGSPSKWGMEEAPRGGGTWARWEWPWGRMGRAGSGGGGRAVWEGAAAEKSGGVEIEAGVLSGEFGGLACGEEGGGSSEVLRWGKGGDGVVVMRELVEGPLPAVAFVLDQALQHGEGGGLAVFGTEGDVAEEWRDARGVCGFGEEASDLGLGILAGSEPAEELKDERRV